MSLSRVKLLALAVAFLGLATVAVASASSTVKLTRCGYINAEYGKSGVYPWKLSCAEGKKIIAASDAKHVQTVYLTAPPGDAAAVKIDGRFWVCGGQMGFYSCGYPYRPARTSQGTSYKGPFTKYVAWVTCGDGSDCAKTTVFYLPPS